MKVTVKFEGNPLEEEFDSIIRLRQECPLLPLLFNIFIDTIMRRL
jgi:hypothetical protein